MIAEKKIGYGDGFDGCFSLIGQGIDIPTSLQKRRKSL
jgi:hypothetical protein